MIKISIIGLGRAGHFHLRSVQQLHNFELHSIVDPKFDDIYNWQNHKLRNESFGQVITNPNIDAVIIATPTSYHYHYISEALKNGKHVFAEKPLGKSIKEIKACYDLAEQNNCCLYLGFQRRYDHNFIELKKSIPKIAPIQMVKTSSRDHPRPSLDYLKISGNIFHDMLIHDFDMLSFLFPDQRPKSIFTQAWTYDAGIAAINDYDTVMVNIQYENGLMVNIDTSRQALYGYDQRIELFGQQGMAIAENVRKSSVQLHSKFGTMLSPIQHSFPERYVNAYRLEIDAFAQGIKEQEYFNITREECLRAHLLADAAYDSVIKNRVIDLTNIL